MAFYGYAGKVVITQSQVKNILGEEKSGKIIYVNSDDTKAYFADLSENPPVEKILCNMPSIHSPLISPDGKSVTFWTGTFNKGGGTLGKVFVSRLKQNAAPVEIGGGIDPHWWIDPATGKTFLVYRTNAGKYTWPNLSGKTMKQEIDPITYQKKGAAIELVNKSFGGGLSKSGRYLFTAYSSAVLYDLEESKGYVVNSGKQTCNGSISPYSVPEKEHWGMLLVLAVTIKGKKYASHEVFTIYDKNDNLQWFIQKPPDTKEWQTPEWSTHENFCTATARQSDGKYHVYLIRISDKKVLKVNEGDYRVPHLWVSSPASQPMLEMPSITPGGGNFTTSQKVTLTGPSGAEVHYTSDGATIPTKDSKKYTNPFTLNQSTVILARAFKGQQMSDVARAVFIKGNPGDTGSQNNQKPAVTVLKPNGGEKYQVGDRLNIIWKTDESRVNDVWISISLDGINWFKLTEKSIGINSDEWGNFGWTVPATIEGIELNSNTFKIRVENYHNHNQYDVSNASFQIQPSAIKYNPEQPVPFILKKHHKDFIEFSTGYPCTIRLFNMKGAMLFQKYYAGSGEFRIFENRLSTGMYQIRIDNKSKKIVEILPVTIR